MRAFTAARWAHSDQRMLLPGAAIILLAMYLMRPEPVADGDVGSLTPGWHDPTQPLKASLFLVGWLILWSSLGVLREIGRRVLLALVLYLVVGVVIRGITPYTPLWSPPGFRTDVLDRLGAWLSWPQYVAGGPVSGFGSSELLMLLLIAILAIWLVSRRQRGA